MTEKERREILCKLQVYDAIYRDGGIFHLNSAEMEVYQTCAKNEEILTFDKKRLLEVLNITLNKDKLYDFQMDAIASYAKPLVESRPKLEFFNTNRIQATVAACIHDSTTSQMLVLEIRKSSGIISDYTKGTLTFPQGHVAVPGKDLRKAVSDGDIRRVLYENIVRELHEELKTTTARTPRGERGPWDIDAMCTIARGAPIIPIYVDKVGSSEKHICFLFDIDMSKYHEKWHITDPLLNPFDEVPNVAIITSNEPNKHFVRVHKVFDMHEIAESNICPWVLRAVGIIDI